MKSLSIGKIMLWLLLVIALLVAATGAYVYSELRPVPASETEKKLTITSGMSVRQIAKLMEEQGFIRNDFLFLVYLRVTGAETKFQAGDYLIKPGTSMDEMVRRLNAGDTAKEATVKLTVPEGYTIEQIAEKMSSIGLNPTVFLGKANSNKDLKSPSAAQIPENPQIKHKLEGYLFPETYEFKQNITEDEVIARMLQETDNKLASLPAGWEAKMKERNLTLHQLLTIASLIEKEVILDEERPLVAGVIYNRINIKMPLQIDATIQYSLDKPKERLFEKDLQVQSPYNSYLNPGLPPGPIASPSLKSIQAALEPKASKYLFYVTKKDGSNGHLFAETFEGHQKNIAESKK